MSSTTVPPLVLRVNPPLPRPGLVEAIGWCLAFLLIQICSALATAALVLGLAALDAENPGEFLIDQMAGLGKSTTKTPPPEGRPPIPGEIGKALAWGMFVAQAASLGFILFVVPRRVGPDWKRQLGLRVPSTFHVLIVVLGLPGFMILSTGVQEVLARLTRFPLPVATDSLNGVFAPWPLWLTVLTVGVGPGVVEELWCRGFLGRGLCARYGLALGVVLTSLLFGFLHVDPLYALVTASMGLYLHFVYLATRSLWVPVLVHAINNGVAILASLGVLPIPQLDADPQGLTPVIYLAAFALVVFTSTSLWTGRARVQSLGVREPDWQPEYPGISAPPPGVDAVVQVAPPSPVAVILAIMSFSSLLYILAQ